MLYNIRKNRPKITTDCFTCPCYNKDKKRCEGIDKVCFEYDETTKTVIDGVTKMPFIPNKEGE